MGTQRERPQQKNRRDSLRYHLGHFALLSQIVIEWIRLLVLRFDRKLALNSVGKIYGLIRYLSDA